LPFLALAGVLALLRAIFTLTVMFTIDISNGWHDDIICWVDDKVQKMKNEK
jgi:hypothetical protein